MFLNILLQIVQGGDTVASATANTVESAAQQYDTLSLWALAVKGGPVMIPIAALLIIAVYIF